MDNHVKGFMGIGECQTTFNTLRDEIPWKIVSYGRGNPTRLTYHYPSQVSTNAMSEINKLIELVSTNYNKKIVGVFMNYFRDGNDYIPYHRDNYGNLDVISLSLGESRDFFLKKDDTKEVTKYTLDEGDLFYLSNEQNKLYTHSVPKRTKISNGRISIVFFAQ